MARSLDFNGEDLINEVTGVTMKEAFDKANLLTTMKGLQNQMAEIRAYKIPDSEMRERHLKSMKGNK